MPEEEKPFDPTPSRIQRARREGNIAKSNEISTAIVFSAGVLALFAVAPQLAAIESAWLFRAARDLVIDFSALGPSLLTLAAVPIAAAVAAVVASIGQARGLLFVAPKFKLDRLKPNEGLKRMFSMQAVVGALRAALAFAAAIAIAVPTVELVFVRGIGSRRLAEFAALATIGSTRVLEGALAVSICFAGVDYFIVRKQWLKKLKMSLYELKKELRENEGSPQMKGRRRQVHRALLGSPVKAVRDASFVVTNPTHIAVAIRYAPAEAGVPRVLAMGAENNAALMRAEAAAHGVPLVEDVALARLLWANATIGLAIPRDTFLAVAEIVTALLDRGSPCVRTA